MLSDVKITDEKNILQKLKMISELHFSAFNYVRHQKGIYEIGHFNFNYMIPNIKEHYPNFENSFSCYGVCDNFQQILEQCPEIENSKDRKFVISITLVRKKDEPKEGGWRWCKWGPYIGTYKMQSEYLYYEPEIEEIFCYHIYELS